MNVSVVRSPQQSVFFTLREIAGTVPDRAFALQPIRRRRSHGAVPNALVPVAPRADVGVADQVDALHEYSPDERVRDIGDTGGLAPEWEPAERDPQRWLDEYADATVAAWRMMQGRWAVMRDVLDRETERIGVAAVRGGLTAALNTLSPRLRFADDCLFLEPPGYIPRTSGQCATRVELAGRSLHLVPSVGPPDALFLHLDEPGLVGLAYPVRRDPTPRTDADPLTVVLGAARARLLRELDRPYPIGEIAARLGLAAGSTTWHCDVLERAGLAARERQGQRVFVSRTAAGWELLDLLRAGGAGKGDLRRAGSVTRMTGHEPVQRRSESHPS